MANIFQYFTTKGIDGFKADVKEYRALKRDLKHAESVANELKINIVALEYQGQDVFPPVGGAFCERYWFTSSGAVSDVILDTCKLFNENAPCKNTKCPRCKSNNRYVNAVKNYQDMADIKRKFWAQKFSMKTK